MAKRERARRRGHTVTRARGPCRWSPDGASLAALDRAGESLRLTVWDVAGPPREVARVDLKDSSGRPRNRVGFTPDGAAVALTDRHDSLLRVELTTGVQRRIEVPDLLQFVMIGATGLVGVDLEYRPHLADFAAGVSSPLTPKLELGGSTRAQLRRAESGAVWTCGALGPGALIELAPVGDEEARARVRRLAAGL